MIKLCEKGKIDVIITKSISRFARNTVDTLVHVRKLKAMGIAVIFEKEGTTDSPNQQTSHWILVGGANNSNKKP